MQPPLPAGWIEPDLHLPGIRRFRITGKPVRDADRTILEE
jgi:hypothetical protein